MEFKVLGPVRVRAGGGYLLDRSLHWWQALSLPVWRARTLRDLAAALSASGDPDAAEAARREAGAIFRAPRLPRGGRAVPARAQNSHAIA